GPPSARRLLPRTANLLCQSCGMNAATPVVLVVEDEPEIATQIVRRLEAEGWTAHSVDDGLAGVEAATTLRPELVVLDVMLPGIDGLEVWRRIQAQGAADGRSAPPVLMLTAR